MEPGTWDVSESSDCASRLSQARVIVAVPPVPVVVEVVVVLPVPPVEVVEVVVVGDVVLVPVAPAPSLPESSLLHAAMTPKVVKAA